MFDTAAIRSRVLHAWAASPARFREDANAEEDLALGGYRDRTVVELAQNAADAATLAGVPGRLRLTLRDRVLVAANSGAPLEAAGVESLCTLRASVKREPPGGTPTVDTAVDTAVATVAGAGTGTVGRFGVGFAGVLAVTDAPAVISRPGGLRWSLADARALVAGVPELAEELVRRSGTVPVLRLPFPAEGGPPDGYDTAVILPLRDSAAEELTRRLLAEIDDALLLTLPGLAEVVVDVDGSSRTITARRDRASVLITDGGSGSLAARTTRWRLATSSGVLDGALLADRPTEERLRTAWSVTWAVPLSGAGDSVGDSAGNGGLPAPLPPTMPAVVHAPTPTEDPLGFAALLIAAFPLDPTRRHVARGPLRDFLTERAAETFARLLTELPVRPELLTLVPGPVGRGELDAEIRRAVLARLPETRFLLAAETSPAETSPGDTSPGDTSPGDTSPAETSSESSGTRLRPRDAVAVEGAGAALIEALTPVLPNLLPAGYERHRSALTAIGVRRLPLAEVIDLLAGVRRAPGWWRRLYDVLGAGLDAGTGLDRDALRALPVPLTDGRQVRGPRGVLVPAGGVEPDVLSSLGLRVAHPEAAHPLLERLGAVPATPRSVLADPAVRAAVAGSYDADDPESVARAVLTLVVAARPALGEHPWLADLALFDAAGDLVPAGELMLAGSPIAELVRPGTLGVVAAELVERWGGNALEAAGVLGNFTLVRDADVVLDPESCQHELDGEDTWLDGVHAGLTGGLDAGLPPVLPEFLAVRDLDLVAEAAWPRALRLLATPPLRAAVTGPARVLRGSGLAGDVVPYTAWWLRRHPVLGGRRPAGLRASGADPLLYGLYEDAATDLDAEFLRGLGVRTTLAALLAEPDGPRELLDRLAEEARPVGRGQLREIYRALATVDPDLVRPPDRLRALVGNRSEMVPEVVEAASAVVLDGPHLLPLVANRPRVVADPRFAPDLADLLALPLASEVVPGVVGAEGTPSPVPEAVRELLPGAPTGYVEHDRLLVDGVELEWWHAVDPDSGDSDGGDSDGGGGPGVVHAATIEGLARGLAWAAGRWERRFEAAALLLEPGRAAELRTEREFGDQLGDQPYQSRWSQPRP